MYVVQVFIVVYKGILGECSRRVYVLWGFYTKFDVT